MHMQSEPYADLMVLKKLFCRFLVGLLLIGFAGFGLGCDSGGGSSRSNDAGPETPGETPGSEPGTGAFLAMVTNPDGEPVANAVIGDLGVTASNGVASGDGLAAPGNWYPVSAVGYAPDFVRAAGEINGTLVYEAILTPVGSRGRYSPGEPTLIRDDPADPVVALTVPGDVFSEEGVFLELTRIPPTRLGPLYAPTGSGEALYPRIAFSIEAFDSNGDEADFLLGSTATVQVTDYGILGDPPVLARFNADSGQWEALGHGTCRRLDENTIEATLTHFSVFGGMGGDAPASERRDYGGARSRYRDAVSKWAEQGGGSETPQEVREALEDLAAEAEAFADANHNEVAKQRLLTVVAQAQLVGMEELSSRLTQKAKDVAQGIAQGLINDPDCGRLREMMGSMAQCQLLGLETEANQLQNKIRDLLNVCSNWHGTINYIMDMENPYPDYGIDELRKHSGPGTWTERHEVVLSVNPENYDITGDDVVTLVAPEVAYRAPEEDPESCSGDGYLELKNRGNPQIGDLFLTIGGGFKPGERPVFTLDMPEKGPGSGDIAIEFKQYFHCPPESVGTGYLPIVPAHSYRSLLVGVGQTPPLTLQEMLNNGQYHDHGWCEIIKGYQTVPLNAAAKGMWPFTRTTVRWHFVQIKPKLE